MKNYYLSVHFLVSLFLGAVAVHAAPLASVKVLVVEGAVFYGPLGAEETPLAEGTILSEGDSIVTGNMGVAHLIFSNGAGLEIQESSNLVLSKLEQRPFWRDDPQEIPEEEISLSSTHLELKYGNIKGHVEGLREDSEFRVNTILGDAKISGNLFFVELFYNQFQREYVLNVQNIDGIVDLITKFSGTVKFGRTGLAVKQYDPKVSTLQIVRIPPRRAVSMRKSSFSQEFRQRSEQFPKDAKSRLILEFETVEPYTADQDVTVVSPNGT